MKIIIGTIVTKLIDIFSKKSRSGEKEQEIEIQKINEFKKWLMIIGIIFVVICGLNELFPILQVSPWWYSMTEKIINYILGGN